MAKELWGPKWMQRREVKDRKQAFTNNMTYDNYLIRKELIREAEHIRRAQIEQMEVDGKLVKMPRIRRLRPWGFK